MPKVVLVRGRDPKRMVEAGLAHFPEPGPGYGRVIVKPNLIIDRPGPTTPVDVAEAVVAYYLERGYEVLVAEGSGWCETEDAFRALGYAGLKERYGVELVDLNRADWELRELPGALVLRELEVPRVLEGAYIVSLALLKTHSLTRVSLSLKNMLGAVPGENVPAGKKRRFHYLGLDECIVDICSYLRPRMAIIDGRVACIGGELGGRPVPYGLMIFSDDPVAADAVGARALGLEPRSVKHIRLAEERGLGTADLAQIELIEIAI